MDTFRRKLLDRNLEASIDLMRGKVLDIGGKRENKRGQFRPILEKVESWQYLNPDATTKPDYYCKAENIPVEDGIIDTVIITEVLEYLEDPEKVLSEIYRILSPQGICLISTPLLIPIHGDHMFDRQRFTPLKLNEMFKKAGFDNIQIEPMGSLGAVLHDFFHVALGYAYSDQRSLTCRIFRRCLHILEPFFWYLDEITKKQKQYLTTGYFIRLSKIGK